MWDRTPPDAQIKEKPMKENNCTFFPEGNWTECCKAHDLAYETQMPKSEADIALFQCVKESGGLGYGLIAALMLAGVSTFGLMFYKKRYKI